jgi:hypothetical protein
VRFPRHASRASRKRHCAAYVVRLIDGDGSDLRGSGSLDPLVAYRLEDGKEIPVRGFAIDGRLPKKLKDVLAAVLTVLGKAPAKTADAAQAPR